MAPALPVASPAADTRSSLARWLPGLDLLLRYDPAWLRHDVVAGLVLTTMLVPVGIAYAAASGVPGIYGLYATIVPLLAYALLGPSRILVLGPDSSLATIILGVVLPLSGGDPQRAVALAGAMAIVSGTVCILAGVLRLGFPRHAHIGHDAAKPFIHPLFETGLDFVNQRHAPVFHHHQQKAPNEIAQLQTANERVHHLAAGGDGHRGGRERGAQFLGRIVNRGETANFREHGIELRFGGVGQQVENGLCVFCG